MLVLLPPAINGYEAGFYPAQPLAALAALDDRERLAAYREAVR
jgi:hypothetical protein